jgi:ABC-type oligopeptide transport system ATPase subunit
MGSGKSTAGRVVKRLLDPTGNEAVTIDRRDFLQKAAHCYILMLDNQNSLPEWFQDTLCRLVTGESDSKRVLYSDDEDLVWSMQRAVLLNGINPPSDRGDVQDRTLPIELERLDKRKRLPEDDFWMQFSLKHPELLGAVFDALAGALRKRHTVQLEERPRLADWGLYAAALYESQGWGVGTFVEDWRGVEETQQQGTLDGSIVAQAVILYMKDKDRVELSAAKLHAAIESRAEDDLDLKDDKTWPKTGRTLWKKIREVTPLLEAHGIRAYRKNDNRSGRPIILDTDFNDDEPDEDNYAKYTDDNADDNCLADDNADDNFHVSSADTPDTYRISDDKANYGRYFGPSLGSHTLIKKKEEIQGERKPDLSSASSANSSSAPKRGRRLTEKEVREVQKLIGEGMAPAFARAAVLGEEVF